MDMPVNLWAIAVVAFNFGFLLLLFRVLRVVLKLPRWFKSAQRFFDRRYIAAQPLESVPDRFDRLNQMIFNSNQKIKQLSQQVASIFQLIQIGLTVRSRSRHRR